MAEKKPRSTLQKKLSELAQKEEVIKKKLQSGTRDFQRNVVENQYSFEKLVSVVKDFGIVEPIREMSTFSRSLKTNDYGKIAIAIAQHLYGKYKVPQYLTNAWNFIIKDTTVSSANVVQNWRRQQASASNHPIPDKEIGLYCAWYAVAATGGSLWKEFTRNYIRQRSWTDDNGTFHDITEEVPMFTKKENHSFLTCPLKNANVREAIIYAIAVQHTNDIGNITRLCKSKLAIVNIMNNPIEFYTRAIWREFIQFFSNNQVPINEMNDLMDYILYENGRNGQYSLKGRTLATLKRNMKDWHWELNRVKRMGNADWSAQAVPVSDETFSLPQMVGVEWTMEQLKTSKALASEGTNMHHCVYSYQPRCVAGTCAIWSLKREVRKKGFSPGKERALTIEMNTTTGDLVQLRGYSNRLPYKEEMIAVKHWASKNNFRVKGIY